MDNLQVLNTEEALKRMGGNNVLYIRIVKKFLDDFGNYDSKIREAVEAGETEEAAFLAHTMKGMAGNLGGEALFYVSDLYQKKLKESGIPGSEDMLACFTDELSKLKESLGQFLEKNK